MTSVTLRDVAAAVGVNISTVSRALSPDRSSLVNPATRERIHEAAQRLGYRGNSQASALRKGCTGTVGVVVADLSNPYIGPTLRGVSEALGVRDLLPFMAETADSRDRLEATCTKLLSQRVDGIILTSARRGEEMFLRKLAREVPVVLAVRPLPNSGLATITHDDKLGGSLAARHLLDLGHRHVSELVGPEGVYTFEARSAGFRETVAEAGGTCVSVRNDDPLPTAKAGRNLALKLLSENEGNMPTAVFAHNDTIAVGAIAVLREHGLSCPADISVVGYNDVPMAGFVDPALTTVRLPGYELGRLAAELLVTEIERGATSSGTVTLAPELIVRSSTATPA